jgi:proteasome lid subunit RPN8/RPN11
MINDRKIIIHPELIDEMRDHVRQCSPEEGCGILAGNERIASKIYRITNALHSPIRFQMDANEQVKAFLEIESLGLEIIAIYHSHPEGPSIPSETDLAEYAYPDVVSIVWFKINDEWNYKAYMLDEKHFEDISVCEVT